MSATSVLRDPYVRSGVLMSVVAVAFYVAIDNPLPAISALFLVLFITGVIVAVGSPTRWSVSTTLLLYRAVPLLVGAGAVVAGGYSFLRLNVPVLSGVLVGWGCLALFVTFVGPWEAIERYLERVNSEGADVESAVSPLPERQFLKLQYTVIGLLTVTTAIVGMQVIPSADLGQLAVLGGVGGAGLININCSPHSGPPSRIIRLRQARWIVLGFGTGVSGLYGGLVVDRTISAVFWSAVTLGIVYWVTQRVSWDDMRDSLAEAQSSIDYGHPDES